MTKLSIIVPVYNVEKYIRPCFESIFKQGLDDNEYEIIIVNDGTKDKSMEIITDIISKHKNVTVINQENQGLSVARNNGIAIAKGEYILMPDSDDMLIENSLKPLLEKALEFQADLVVVDFLKMTDEEIKNIKNISQKDFYIKEKKGEQLFLEDLNPCECFVWRTLYRRSFLLKENITFYPGIRYQDIPFTHECYLKAGNCIRISWLLNIYRKWPGASTLTFNETKAKDFCMALSVTWNLTHLQGLSPALDSKLREDIWTSFFEMTRLTCRHIKNAKERKGIIDFMHNKVPDLSFQNGGKQKIATLLYKNKPRTLMWLCYIYVALIENKLLPFYYHRLKPIVS